MRVLVTGATGLIGRAVVRKLVEKGHETIALVRTPGKKAVLPTGTRVFQGDIMIPESLDRLLSLSDAVVHCATIVDYGLYPEELVRRVNLHGTLNLLGLARDAGIRRFLYVGSIAAYGTGNIRDDIRDETSLEKRPNRFNSPYELSKYRTAIAIIRDYPETILVMPGVVYGPGSQIDILLRLMVKLKPGIFVGSDNRLPFVHVDDAAEAIALALEKAPPGQYLCVSDVISLKELGSVLARIAGAKPPVFVRPGVLKFIAGPGTMFLKLMGINSPLNPCSVRMVLGDWGLCSKRLMELGWRPRTLEEGLEYLCNV